MGDIDGNPFLLTKSISQVIFVTALPAHSQQPYRFVWHQMPPHLGC